jgi:hypothetical protein
MLLNRFFWVSKIGNGKKHWEVGWETFFHGKRTHDFPHVRGLTLFNLLRGLFFFLTWACSWRWDYNLRKFKLDRAL